MFGAAMPDDVIQNDHAARIRQVAHATNALPFRPHARRFAPNRGQGKLGDGIRPTLTRRSFTGSLNGERV